MTLVRTTFNVEEKHIATIKQVAKDNGRSSDSAALRYIIDDWVKRVLGDNGYSLTEAEAITKAA